MSVFSDFSTAFFFSSWTVSGVGHNIASCTGGGAKGGLGSRESSFSGTPRFREGPFRYTSSRTRPFPSPGFFLSLGTFGLAASSKLPLGPFALRRGSARSKPSCAFDPTWTGRGAPLIFGKVGTAGATFMDALALASCARCCQKLTVGTGAAMSTFGFSLSGSFSVVPSLADSVLPAAFSPAFSGLTEA